MVKVFNATEKKRGQGKFGEWVMITFQDENGQVYSSFDDFLLNVENGAEVDGKIEVTNKDGKTYYNFKADKKGRPIELSTPGSTPAPTPGAPRPPQSEDEKWGVKDVQIAYQNANNVAAVLLQGKGADAVGEFDQLQAHVYGKFLAQDFKADYAAVKKAQAEAPPAVPAEIDASDVPF